MTGVGFFYGGGVGGLFARCSALTGGIQGAGYLHGYLYQTEHWYDFTGAVNSLAFLAVGAATVPGNMIDDPRKILMGATFALSRAWLLGFLTWRAGARGGDARFDELKISWWKYLIVWALQGIWVLGVAMPLIVTAGMKSNTGALTVGQGILGGLFGAGLVLEVWADIVKARWVSAGRKGYVCSVAPWTWSRHPNYFGEILMWWSAWGLCMASGASSVLGWTLGALASPFITTTLLLFVSGMPLAEGQKLERFYTATNPEVTKAYIEYREKTSPLVPLPCWLWTKLPAWMKRVFFFEWDRYAYKAPDAVPAVADTLPSAIGGRSM